MFHYGWARPAQALREKRELGKTMYPWRNADERLPLLAWIPGIKPFRENHPEVAREWIERRLEDPERVIAPRQFRCFPRYYVSGDQWLTGVRVFEVRSHHRGDYDLGSSWSRWLPCDDAACSLPAAAIAARLRAAR
jgi:hypothetical protein